MNKYIIMLMGPNGFGKGTQASRMVKAYDLVHISVGDIFRWNIQYHTKLAATRGQASARSVRHAHNGRSRQIRDKRDCMVTVQTDFSSRRSRMLLTLLHNGLRSASGDAFMGYRHKTPTATSRKESRIVQEPLVFPIRRLRTGCQPDPAGAERQFLKKRLAEVSI